MTDAARGGTALRTSFLGGLTAADQGRELTLTGWVHRRRDLGGLLFVDLRDRSGLLQVSIGPDWTDPAEYFGRQRRFREDEVDLDATRRVCRERWERLSFMAESFPAEAGEVD